MLQFQCPHCGGAFRILPTMAGQQLACPHCTGVVLVPETLPSEAHAGGVSPWQTTTPEPPVSVAPSSALPPSSPPIQFNRPVTASQAMPPIQTAVQAFDREPTRLAASGRPKRELRKLSSDERSFRRLVKNVILFAVCAIVLVVVFWWLLRSGPL